MRKIGITGPDEDLAQLERLIADALELRVGATLAELFTQEQLDEFEALMDDDDTEEERLALLKHIYPEYPKVVEQEKIRLQEAIERSSDKAAYIRQLA
ncbi:MAG: DUF5663 domain-containing protein [Candidatus Saccharibacteria bacterium]